MHSTLRGGACYIFSISRGRRSGQSAECLRIPMGSYTANENNGVGIWIADRPRGWQPCPLRRRGRDATKVKGYFT